MSKTILITGCSSGIGAGLAQELHRRGERVFATATMEFIVPVVDKLLQASPPPVIRGGKGSVSLLLLKKLLPLKMFDARLSSRFGLDKFHPEDLV